MLLFLAGCAAPAPFPLPELEGLDRRFAAPGPADGAVPALLRKGELTLEEAMAIADRLNPALAAERLNLDLASAALWEAGLPPNPSLIVEVEDYRPKDGIHLGRMERTAGLAFPLVLGGRLAAAEAVASRERDVAGFHYLWKRRELLTDVKRAFVSLLSARGGVDLARESRELARTLHAAAEERLRLQAAPEMEVLKAAVGLAKADLELRRSEKDVDVARRTLQGLLGDVDLPLERIAGSLAARFVVPSLDALRGHVTSAHPLLEAARRGKEAAERELDLARAERIPDVDLTLVGGVDAEGYGILEAGLSIPLPLWNRQGARIARAETRIRQSDFQAQAARNDVLLRLAEAYRTFTSAQERAGIYADEILPKAAKALSQTEEGWRLGRFGHLDLLDAQRTASEARGAHAAALLDLNLAAADLEKLTGIRMESIR
jgi:cobalt-zinc-cadmium efflux system outer membrane protein